MEKNRVVILRPRAQMDLDAISERYPQKVMEQLIDKIKLLYTFPMIGPTMDKAYTGYRSLLCGKYRIIYEIISDTRIEVAYIRHCSRQFGLRVVEGEDT
jgi:plasmid stabilization system protein ParE